MAEMQTHPHIFMLPAFNDPMEEFGKHWEKRKCWQPAFPPFSAMFSQPFIKQGHQKNRVARDYYCFNLYQTMKFQSFHIEHIC